MSVDSVKQIIGRAMTDGEFKEILFSNPASALEGYELSDEERAALKNLTRQEFDALGGELEQRVSRAGISPHHSCGYDCNSAQGGGGTVT